MKKFGEFGLDMKGVLAINIKAVTQRVNMISLIDMRSLNIWCENIINDCCEYRSGVDVNDSSIKDRIITIGEL